MSALVKVPYLEPRRATWRRLVMGWLLASIAAGFLSSLANSYVNLSGLVALGVDIPFNTKLEQYIKDYKGVGPILTLLIAIGMAIAMSVAGIIRLKVKALRSIVYMLAGAACMVVMFVLMEQAFFGTPIIQGARTANGLVVQALCGAMGGWVFAGVTRPK